MVTTGLSADSYHFIPASRQAWEIASGDSSSVHFCWKRRKIIAILCMGGAFRCVGNDQQQFHYARGPTLSLAINDAIALYNHYHRTSYIIVNAIRRWHLFRPVERRPAGQQLTPPDAR